VLSAAIVFLALSLLVSVLGWTVAQGAFSGIAAVAGLVVGVLLVVAWSLRDGLLQGEPRFALAQSIARWFFIAAVTVAAIFWISAPDSIGAGALTTGVVFLAYLLFVKVSTASVNREVEGGIVTFGPGGHDRALIVYHSAHGGFMRAMQEALAEGMQAQGWRVDLSPASRLSPVDITPYQLVVIGTPCYNRGVARPIETYLKRLGSDGSRPVVIVVTGFNYTERATKKLRERIEQAHGTVGDEIELWTARPNRMRDGAADSAEIMRRSGARLGRAVAA
jgi:menaquinone-dependent protoporphyrinogen IX oxidase